MMGKPSCSLKDSFWQRKIGHDNECSLKGWIPHDYSTLPHCHFWPLVAGKEGNKSGIILAFFSPNLQAPLDMGSHFPPLMGGSTSKHSKHAQSARRLAGVGVGGLELLLLLLFKPDFPEYLFSLYPIYRKPSETDLFLIPLHNMSTYVIPPSMRA